MIKRRCKQRGTQPPLIRIIALIFIALIYSANSLFAQTAIDFPTIDATLPIELKANTGSQIDRGSYRIYRFTGDVQLKQGSLVAQAQEIIVWTDRVSIPDVEKPSKYLIQLSGNVEAKWGDGQRLKDTKWQLRLYSFLPFDYRPVQWEDANESDFPLLELNEADSTDDSATNAANWQPKDGDGAQSGVVDSTHRETNAGAFRGVAQTQDNGEVTQAQFTQVPAPQQPMNLQPLGPVNSNARPLAAPGSSLQTLAPPPTLSPNQPATLLPAPNAASSGTPNTNDGNTTTSAAPVVPTMMPDPMLPQFGGTGLPGAMPGTMPGVMPSTGVTIDPGPPMPVAPPLSGAPAPGTPWTGPWAAPGATAPSPVVINPGTTSIPMGAAPAGSSTRFNARRIGFNARSSIQPQVRLAQRPEGGSVVEITRGVRITVYGAQTVQADGTVLPLGDIDLETDRAIVWGPALSNLDFSGTSSIEDQPIELYLEGNIVFHQGQRVIYAERMYYNVQQEYGMVLSAEILTPIPEYQGLLRLKADVLQQRNRQNFLAYDAALTSSRLGVPRYWVQAGQIEFEDRRPDTPDPLAGAPGFERRTNMQATARNNFVYLGGLPVFYWPTLSTNLAEPDYYLTGFKVKNDSIFGFQVFTDWDLYQLLGINGADGTSWNISADYLSERGPALGTNFAYDLPTLLGHGRATGNFDAWGIQDSGLDTLGRDRENMVPEATTRGRVLFLHRQYLTPDLEFWAEVGLISDRNFLEQYFERAWDTQKDYSTALRLRKYAGNQMFDVWGQARVNDFFTETEWLPRVDHFMLGQALFADRVTWYAHSNVGYAKQQIATVPTAPQDAATFQYLPWEKDREGLRAATRQEIDLPFELGSSKLVPYLSGEAAYWGEDLNGNDVTRLTGQAGIRSSLPMWKLYPNVQSRLYDVRGLMHKVTFETELFYADSNQNVDQFPLYDAIDDNSQESFRRRMIFNTFGGTTPPQFDERSFALRSGLQRWVSANSTEIADDMSQARFGVNQRWQTKRGLPGRERIVDLIELDLDGIIFPNANRDNFGQTVGAINYDFRYHVGDRLTLLSDGYFDLFDQGLKTVSVGAQISRMGRGSLYFGAMSLEGPISTSVLTASVNYRMAEKWILTGGSTVDLGETGNIGQSLALTRIGEAFLIRAGMIVDSGRNNVGFQFMIEPRFLPAKRLGSIGGQLIPPAGFYGLE